MGLSQIGAMSPSPSKLSCGVQGQALAVDLQWQRLGDEGRLATSGRAPARDRVVLGQMQSYIRSTEA